MDKITKFIFTLFLSVGATSAFIPFFRRSTTIVETFKGNAGNPLLLSPYIENNEIEEAKSAARVNLDGINITSYSGYLTVNKQFNSNLFFWFFPSQNDYEEDPVLLWLQGGPGSSSLLGLFLENGPIYLNRNSQLKMRKYTWTTYHSVLYVDNPVGTGFSFTDNGYAENQTQIGIELYNALTQFFTLFPNLQKNDFYITGESYAGKYIPAIGYIIHQNNPTAKVKINLQGMAIGNGLSDPVNQLNQYSNYLYEIGLIDKAQIGIFEKYEATFVEYVNAERYHDAYDVFNNLTSLMQMASGYENLYNYLVPKDILTPFTKKLANYLHQAGVRRALHVGNITYQDGYKTHLHLRYDIPVSVVPWIVELLKHYRILLYNGQLDLIVAYPLTLNYLQNLEFKGASEYKSAARIKWHVRQELAGYVKVGQNLVEALVRNAGHLVPHDQPEWALDLISKFIRREPFR